jgi:exodeoxyribonuclease V alpha subunit
MALKAPEISHTDLVIYHGVLERIIYLNEHNHYCVGELKIDEHKQAIIIAGLLPSVQCGETLEVKGQWTHNAKYGQQFKIITFESKLPSTLHGIRQYLGSGLVPGVAKGYANKIVDYFGIDTMKVISEESARLQEIPGIGRQRAHSIKEAWESQQVVREVMLFLKTYGIGSAQCLRLVKKYGNLARRVLEENPYQIAQDIHGIGFKTADKIALNLGFANDSIQRIDAGILFALSENEAEGHTTINREALIKLASELLKTNSELISKRLAVLIEKQIVYLNRKHDCIQIIFTEKAEAVIVRALAQTLQEPSQLPTILIDKAIEWAQSRAGFTFAPEQIESIKNCLSTKLSIITGGPGTGKTTILQALVDILRAKKVNLALAAPTGRAAQRMQETTGNPAQTIHRLLQFDPHQGGFVINEKNPLDIDYLIIDEASMLDTRLAASIFKAVLPKTHIVFVGDIFQLPSVGAGNVLKDFIESGLFKVTELHQIFRQSKRSHIATTAHSILSGDSTCPTLLQTSDSIDADCDLYFIEAVTSEDCLKKCTEVYQKILKHMSYFHPLQDIQVLAPLYKGTAGIANLNQHLQLLLNTLVPQPATASSNPMPQPPRFHVGDKVIQTRNNYDKAIFNGDLGIVKHIDTQKGVVVVSFDEAYVELDRSDMADLSLAYAISVHKAQGSEFPVVIIPWIKSYFLMLQRNLLYTAITRGRQKVFIVGDPAAYAMAVNNKENIQRRTGLSQKLGS